MEKEIKFHLIGKEVYLECPKCKSKDTFAIFFTDMWILTALILYFTVIFGVIGLIMTFLIPLVALLNRNVEVKCDECEHSFIVGKRELKLHMKKLNLKEKISSD